MEGKQQAAKIRPRICDRAHASNTRARINCSPSVPSAAPLLLTHFQGQFIYTKYAFEALRARPYENGLWSLAELQEQLPPGLHGMYT